MIVISRFLVLLLVLFLTTPSPASSQGVGKGLIVGSNRIHALEEGENLIQLARLSGLGYRQMVGANPGVDPWSTGGATEVLLPFRTILPPGIVEGITINLAELRLYLVRNTVEGLQVKIFPVGIGDQGRETPRGSFTIANKIENPYWSVPSSVRLENPELPDAVPPGRRNPLGRYWLGLSEPGYGIHGTNAPYGIGRRVSRGCIRLYPEHIAELFTLVDVGTSVQILYQPLKMGVSGERLFLEAHEDYMKEVDQPEKVLLDQMQSLKWQGLIDWHAIDRAISETRGVPVPVSFSGKQTDTSLAEGEPGGSGKRGTAGLRTIF